MSYFSIIFYKMKDILNTLELPNLSFWVRILVDVQKMESEAVSWRCDWLWIPGNGLCCSGVGSSSFRIKLDGVKGFINLNYDSEE